MKPELIVDDIHLGLGGLPRDIVHDNDNVTTSKRYQEPAYSSLADEKSSERDRGDGLRLESSQAVRQNS